MNFNISSFRAVVKPFLETLAKEFPNSCYTENQQLTGAGDPIDVLRFLMVDGYISCDFPTTGSFPSSGSYRITTKGLSLLNIDFKTEFQKEPSVYESGEIGC